MASLFYTPKERRYADYPRRYLNEYHCDARKAEPTTKGPCATLFSARNHATRAIDHGFCTVVRIFDRKTGQYVMTYKGSAAGIARHEGYVR